MEYFNKLPEEITLEILTRVPAESVLECKSVCTTWNNLVHRPSFSKMHFYHHSNVVDSGKLGFLAITEDAKFYYFEYTDQSTPIQGIKRVKLTSPFRKTLTTFVGSCNGLICFSQAQSVCVCNPITKELVVLPEIKRIYDNRRYFYGEHSFGYVSSTKEYKVLGIYVSKIDVEVHIYTIGSGSGWRNLGKFNSEFIFNTWDVAGTFANGALFWLDNESRKITTFDLAEEKFCQHLSPPPLPLEIDWRNSTIGVLNGFLFFATCVDDERDGFSDVWLLKKKNDNHDMKERNEFRLSLEWSKEFKDVNDCKLLAVTKSDGIITYVYNSLNIYDAKTSASETILDFQYWFFQVFPHKNTLISLKELGEEDTQTVEPVELQEYKNPE